MANASASRGSVAYVEEVTPGVTPTITANLIKELPVQTTSLWMTRETIEDPTISPDRLGAAPVPGNVGVAGDVVVTLRHKQYDDLLASVMGGTWTSDVLNQGSDKKSFTFERAQNDILQYQQFRGVRVNTFDMSVAPGGVVSATFGLMGAGMTLGPKLGGALARTATLDKSALTSFAPAAAEAAGVVKVGGTKVCITAMSLNVDNGMTSAYCIGSNTASEIVWDKGIVTGSVTFYYEDIVQIQKYVDNVASSIEFTLYDSTAAVGANWMKFYLPKVNFTGADVPLANTGQLFVTMPFTASRAAVTGGAGGFSSLQITRSA